MQDRHFSVGELSSKVEPCVRRWCQQRFQVHLVFVKFDKYLLIKKIFTRSSCSIAAWTGNLFESTNLGWIPSIFAFSSRSRYNFTIGRGQKASFRARLIKVPKCGPFKIFSASHFTSSSIISPILFLLFNNHNKTPLLL